MSSTTSGVAVAVNATTAAFGLSSEAQQCRDKTGGNHSPTERCNALRQPQSDESADDGLLKEPVIPEAFRGKIQKTASIVGKAFPSHTDFTGRHRRMKEHCLDTPEAQVVHLILHKRNQRRNHNSKAAKDKPRHLKRNGFSASGRHKAKGVVAVKHRPHNLLLKRAERPESPMTAQDFLCPFHLFSESLMSRIINCTESGFPARPGLLYGVTDVYGLMRVYMLEIRSHIERNCVYHTARAVVLKFKLNMLQILSHEFARTEIKDIPCYEYRLRLPGP